MAVGDKAKASNLDYSVYGRSSRVSRISTGFLRLKRPLAFPLTRLSPHHILQSSTYYFGEKVNG